MDQSLQVRQLIGRGLLAGAAGGLCAFVFARIFAEPLISRAIDYETQRGAAEARLAGMPEESGGEIFSRGVQANLGIGVGIVLFGVAMGALVAVAYSLCMGRTGGVRPRPLALLVAAAGFVAICLVPFAKYPSNPPAVGSDDTIRNRGSWFLVVVLIAVLSAIVAVALGQTLQPRLGTWNASVVSGLGYLVVIGVLFAGLPSFTSEMPEPLRDPTGQMVFPGFPSEIVAEFRAYTVAAHLVLWGVIALVFAPLADRVVPQTPVPPERVDRAVTARTWL